MIKNLNIIVVYNLRSDKSNQFLKVIHLQSLRFSFLSNSEVDSSTDVVFGISLIWWNLVDWNRDSDLGGGE